MVNTGECNSVESAQLKTGPSPVCGKLAAFLMGRATPAAGGRKSGESEVLEL